MAASAAACARPEPETEQTREAREAMLSSVASRFREPSAALGVTAFESVEWKDACLEIRRRGPCPPGSIPGYRLRLSHRGESWEYRARATDPSDVALAAGPDPGLGKLEMEWSWASAPGGCRTFEVSSDGRPAVGWCDGPLALTSWLEGSFSANEWGHLSGRFAPFTLDSVASGRRLVFTGHGTEQASPAWRAAIESWAALRWSELEAGRSGAAHSRAMAFRRPARDGAGTCDILEVTEYGVAYEGRAACEGGGGQTGRAAWLDDALWEEFHAHLSAWGPYSDEARGIYFFGKAERTPTSAEVRELLGWADRAMANVASAPSEAWPR